MKYVAILFALFFAVASANRNVEKNINQIKSQTTTETPTVPTVSHCYNSLKSLYDSESSKEVCNAKYGAFANKDSNAISMLEKFTMNYVYRSYHYLLMAAHFGNYKMNRAGFQKYFQKLSDESWEQSIDLIKFITKRGGAMTFHKPSSVNAFETFEPCEIRSFSNALDIEKHLAIKAFNIHAATSGRLRDMHHDSEIASYIEENFVHKQSSLIRELAGHFSDLAKISDSSNDYPLGLFLFDEYLKS